MLRTSPWRLLTAIASFGAAFAFALAGRFTAPTYAEPAVAVEPADETAEKTELGHDWVRLLRNDDGDVLGMQTAIVRYAGTAGTGSDRHRVEVDLIGAVHIGDAAYYRELNDRFTKYDALLYELVAPAGTVVEKGRGTSNAHPVGLLQNGIKHFLELEHQLELVDYTKPNFVHADMSPDEFVQAMQDRNETFLQMYLRLLGQAMAQQGQMQAKGESLDVELFAALFSNDRPRKLKIALAKQLSEMESFMVSFGGEQGTVIITDRNKKALNVLKQQIAAGKKHLGIFYGAGHLNDMDERLREDFKLTPVGISWVTAWDLAEKQ